MNAISSIGLYKHLLLLSSLGLLLVAGIEETEARKVGRFLSSFVSRGVSHGAGQVFGTTPQKVYSPDVLTVNQLAECLRNADRLDVESEELEKQRLDLKVIVDQVDRQKSTLEEIRIRHDST